LRPTYNANLALLMMQFVHNWTPDYTVCTQLAENATFRSVVYSSPRVEQKSYVDDQSMNVMVFGVAEN
jgi:hypothetical protein